MAMPNHDPETLRAAWSQAVNDYANGRGTVGALIKHGTNLADALAEAAPPRPVKATCPTHGDPLVCLACETEEDARPEWQTAHRVTPPRSYAPPERAQEVAANVLAEAAPPRQQEESCENDSSSGRAGGETADISASIRSGTDGTARAGNITTPSEAAPPRPVEPPGRCPPGCEADDCPTPDLCRGIGCQAIYARKSAEAEAAAGDPDITVGHGVDTTVELLREAASRLAAPVEMPEAPACEQHGTMVADDLMGNSWHCAACSAVWPQPESPDKDSYEANGVWYCGRCHQRLFIAAPVGEQELCRLCEGNGVLKIPGGVSVCPRCRQTCYEPPAPPPPAEAQEEQWLGKALARAKQDVEDTLTPAQVRELRAETTRLRAERDAVWQQAIACVEQLPRYVAEDRRHMAHDDAGNWLERRAVLAALRAHQTPETGKES